MTKYKELPFNWGGQQYIFITRGKAKEFTPEEALDYLQSKQGENIGKQMVAANTHLVISPVFKERKLTESEKAEIYEGGQSTWQIPDDKMRRHMFRKDLSMGISFCVKKYGQSEEVIKKEAQRLAMRT